MAILYQLSHHTNQALKLLLQEFVRQWYQNQVRRCGTLPTSSHGDTYSESFAFYNLRGKMSHDRFLKRTLEKIKYIIKSKLNFSSVNQSPSRSWHNLFSSYCSNWNLNDILQSLTLYIYWLFSGDNIQLNTCILLGGLSSAPTWPGLVSPLSHSVGGCSFSNLEVMVVIKNIHVWFSPPRHIGHIGFCVWVTVISFHEENLLLISYPIN